MGTDSGIKLPAAGPLPENPQTVIPERLTYNLGLRASVPHLLVQRTVMAPMLQRFIGRGK